MRILSCPETSKGEFHLQKHVEASYQVTVEQWYFYISIQDCTLTKIEEGPVLWICEIQGAQHMLSLKKKTEIF